MKQYIEKLNLYIDHRDEYKIKKYLFKLREYQAMKTGGGQNEFNQNLPNLPTEKKQIIEFILDKFDGDCFERMDAYNEDHGFKNFNHFVKHNKQCIKNLQANDSKFIITLIDKIQREELMQCDEENYIEWETFMIYFNIDGKLVTMHPR